MKLRFAVLSLIAAGVLSAANLPVYINAGAVRCGIVKRGVDQVQIWCWSGLVFSATTAKSNSSYWIEDQGTMAVRDIFPVNPEGVIDNTALTFTRDGAVIHYTVSGNGSEPRSDDL